MYEFILATFDCDAGLLRPSFVVVRWIVTKLPLNTSCELDTSKLFTNTLLYIPYKLCDNLAPSLFRFLVSTCLRYLSLLR